MDGSEASNAPTALADVDLPALLRQLPGFVMVTSGPDHVVEFVNEGLRELTHYRELVGNPLRQALPELADQQVLAIRDEVYRTGKPYRGTALPYRIRPAPDAPLGDNFIDCVFQPIKREDGSVSGIIFAGYDVSDRKKAEEQARALQAEVMQMYRSSVMGAMAMVLAHELNQPLQAISNYATAARRLNAPGETPDPVRLESAMDEIESAARRASDIIRMVREMLGKGRPQNSRVDLAVAIRQAVGIGLVDIGRRGITHSVELEPKLLIEGDPIQVQQVLLNLLRNAIDALDGAERRELEILAARVDDEAEIRVCDSGPGVDPKVRKHLFQPFVTTKAEGLGVGLSICRGIVERLGGRIALEDREGGGTCFCIRLPLAE